MFYMDKESYCFNTRSKIKLYDVIKLIIEQGKTSQKSSY